MGGQGRQKRGRVTPKGGAPVGRLTATERAGLEPIFAQILRSAPEELTNDLPPVAIEMWASELWSIWAKAELVGMDAIEVFAGGLIKYAAQRATPAAVLVLRALASVAPPPYRVRAGREADRLVARGVQEGRRWVGVVGTGVPTTAYLSHDSIDDDGVLVMVAFDGPGKPSTVGVYVDHNLGGIAKDVFVAPAGMEEVLAKMKESDQEGLTAPEYREIPLQEAAARWRVAFDMTKIALDPPASKDLDHWRALVMARLERLPSGGKSPRPAELADEARDQLLAEFLDSDETIGLWEADEAESVPGDGRDLLSRLGAPQDRRRRGRLHPAAGRVGGLDPFRRKAPGDTGAVDRRCR